MTLTPGLSAKVQLVVGDADTAQSLGSGDVPVLGTPRVVALLEAATVAATSKELDGGQTTVGVRIDIQHNAPTAVGKLVEATASLAHVDGRRLVFEVTLHDGDTVAAQGTIERVLLDRQRFVDKALSS